MYKTPTVIYQFAEILRIGRGHYRIRLRNDRVKPGQRGNKPQAHVTEPVRKEIHVHALSASCRWKNGSGISVRSNRSARKS